MRLVRMPGDPEALDHTMIELHDLLISHLFRCGMELAAVLSRDKVDTEDRRRLQAMIQELDGAVRTARHSAFSRSTAEAAEKTETIEPTETPEPSFPG